MARRTVQRQSQLITTFGPGAMVDLPTRSVLIGGLDRWRVFGAYRQIDEPALVQALERGLRKQGRWEEGRTLRLVAPPVAEGDDHRDPPGVDVTVFPTWFLCERVETPNIGGVERRGRRMVRWVDLEPTGGKKRFQHDDGKKDEVTPIRFVGACENGHLQDIDWRRLVHGGDPCHEPMYLTEEGTSANLADLEMVCACGQSLSMRDATLPGRLGLCQGRQPWLSADAQEECTRDNGRRTQLRLLTRSATNAYFPQSISVISLPIDEDRLVAIVERHWAALSEIETAEQISMARQFNPQFRDDVREYSDEDVLDRINRIRERTASENIPNPRLAEFDILASGRGQIGVNDPDARLYATTLDRASWATETRHDLRAVGDVVAVHRLREVMCLYGFTRFEPAPTSADDELEDVQLAVTGAPIAEHADWLPAIEQFGEGIFIRFDNERIDDWIQEKSVRERFDELYAGFEAYRRKHPGGAEQRFPGLAYVALHSLAHAVMTEISLDCGYPASSLKERIYAFPPHDGSTGRYGILIYTASTGAQGTLGGLVANAPRIATIMDAALERISLCSNDPVCADHDPSNNAGELSLLGAACHGCLLIAETSCERRNQFLDRSLLVTTLAENGAGLFPSG